MNKKEGNKLAREIAAVTDNVKAEIIVAALLKAGVSLAELQLENAGTFSRPYRKDVLDASCVEMSDHSHAIKIKISRNGVYDLVPEAISHAQQIDEGASRDVKFLTDSYKQRKKEETAARKFFSPFEQEFLFHGVKLEQEEEELLTNPAAVFFRFLSEFWGISGELNAHYQEVLIRILPFIHSISGNLDRIKDCLQTLLEVPVAYSLDHRTQDVKLEHNKLGRGKLGMDFTLGSCVHAIPYVTFIVGPVAQSKLINFLPGGCINNFIFKFFSYTMPFEAETVLQILAENFAPKEGDNSFGTLGYSASI